MRLTVSVVGGLFDDDRVLSIDDRELKITEDGRVRSNRQLAPADADHVHDLAERVADLELPASPASDYAVDRGTTTIEITEDASGDTVRRRIVLSAGDDAPEPVWALLDTLEALCRRDSAEPR